MRETPLDPNRCAKRIYQHWGAKQCSRPPKAGSAYCKQHDPATIEAKRAAREAFWLQQHEVERQEREVRKRHDAERQRKLDSQPALLAACEELLKYPSSAPAWVLGQVQDAIKAARGKA